MTWRLGVNAQKRGSALVIATFLILIMMVGAITYMHKSNSSMLLSSLSRDTLDAGLQMESGQTMAEATFEDAVEGIIFDGRFAASQGWVEATYNNVFNNYVAVSGGPMQFLEDVIEAQALDASGSPIAGHELADFATAFPTTWTDPDLNDDIQAEIRYTFTPSAPDTTQTGVIVFRYGYLLETRGYGSEHFTKKESSLNGEIEITVSGQPFSQFALFRSTTSNQNGSALVFAGGNAPGTMQEVFRGPVHVNGRPYFYGAPVFMGQFTSSEAESNWWYGGNSSYTGSPDFQSTTQGGVAEVDMPTELFNTLRLAAGDPSDDAAINNAAVDSATLVSFLEEHADGTIPTGTTSVSQGIYLPVNNQSDREPTGGVYVEGDAKIVLDVVQGASDFGADQWSFVNTTHQSCKFQKIQVNPETAGDFPSKDIYVADDPCEVTYVYDPAAPTSAPTVLNGRINGNIHVNGAIDEIGGASRTRPAIAKDFSFNVSAQSDVRVVNDIQYEDATYVEVNSDGSEGSTVVATPNGEYDSSGILPTAENLAPKVSSSSQTVLGLISYKRNVLLHQNSPANLNLHAAIYAGNDQAYNSSTGEGCGSNYSSTRGCGFGNEGWDSRTGLGSFKFLGSISEYKSQSMGVLSDPPTGYQRRLVYDERLQGIMPPGFPISSKMNAVGTIQSYRVWRYSSAD